MCVPICKIHFCPGNLLHYFFNLVGVLDAVPLDENLQQDGVWSNHSVAFDALMEFADYTELEATQYIFDFFGHLTTGVSLMNPGWEQVGSGLDHELKRFLLPLFLNTRELWLMLLN